MTVYNTGGGQRVTGDPGPPALQIHLTQFSSSHPSAGILYEL